MPTHMRREHSGLEALHRNISMLTDGRISPIRFQLTQPLAECTKSMQYYIKRKAAEVITASLNCIAPWAVKRVVRSCYRSDRRTRRRKSWRQGDKGVTYQHALISTYYMLYFVYAYLSRLTHLCKCRKAHPACVQESDEIKSSTILHGGSVLQE